MTSSAVRNSNSKTTNETRKVNSYLVSHILSDSLANVIPFPYLCPRLLSSAFVRFWLLHRQCYLFHDSHLLNNPLPLR